MGVYLSCYFSVGLGQGAGFLRGGNVFVKPSWILTDILFFWAFESDVLRRPSQDVLGRLLGAIDVRFFFSVFYGIANSH